MNATRVPNYILAVIELGVFATLALQIQAQAATAQASLKIGDAKISLGMSREQVWQLFKKTGLHPSELPQMTHGPNEEYWTICESSDQSSANCETEGSVMFRSGVVVLATVRWGARADSAPAVARAFIGAIHHLAQESGSHCEIGTDNQDDPKFALSRAQVRCGDHHTIAIMAFQDQNGTQSAEVQESISERVLPLKSN